MDTMYSNKKYLQSLTAGSDFYRSSNSVRPVNNDYTYQNTIGCRSTLGPYTHMSKYSYPTDVSLSSHYGYNSWGIWRDTRNISTSAFTKKQRNIKSFSIILMTAAIIVVLAVLSVAGLAFYFSSFKSEIDDSILVFDGSFRVLRGDVYTTGLKYNHTSMFRQKSEYYQKFIKSAFENNGLVVSRCDITGFGDGPLIHPNFRVFLDMRKIPMTINNVEHHIASSLMDEIISVKSSYKNLKIDPDTIDIKRLLDHDVLRTAFLVNDQTFNIQNSSSTNFEDKFFKKSGVIEKSIYKLSSNTKQRPTLKPINESDIDLDNLPVIQGSFEVTKTDADITQRRLNISSGSITSTLRPIVVSPIVLKMKEPIKHTGFIEKVTTTLPFAKEIVKINKSEIMKAKEKSTTTINFITQNRNNNVSLPDDVNLLTITTIKNLISSLNQSEVNIPTESLQSIHKSETNEMISTGENIPQLDVSLFTSAPILDNEPWRPISVTAANIKEEGIEIPVIINPVENVNVDLPNQNLQNEKKLGLFSVMFTENPVKPVFYKSFTNPAFSTGTLGIEKLGTSEVRPFPIPVNKLINESASGKQTIESTIENHSKTEDNLGYIDEQILQNKDLNLTLEEIPMLTTTIVITETEANTKLPIYKNNKIKNINEHVTQSTTSHLGEMLYELLEIKDNSRFDPTYNKEVDDDKRELNLYNKNKNTLLNYDNTTEEPFNLEFRNKPSNIEAETKPTEEEFITFSTISDDFSTSNEELSSKVQTFPHESTETNKENPILWNQEQLFPINEKWESMDGTLLSPDDNNSMKKVFNETLQALVVENMQVKPKDKSQVINIEKNNQENIQNLSSIFDTLATKLGITPNVPSKVPPFSTYSQNKYRVNKPLKIKTTSTPLAEIMTTVKEDPTQTYDDVIPVLLNSSAETVIGEAEIEEIDPIKFEEFLKQQTKETVTSTTISSLVTLLPVKSNSGLRILRPRPVISKIAAYENINNNSKFKSGQIVQSSVYVNSK